MTEKELEKIESQLKKHASGHYPEQAEAAELGLKLLKKLRSVQSQFGTLQAVHCSEVG